MGSAAQANKVNSAIINGMVANVLVVARNEMNNTSGTVMVIVLAVDMTVLRKQE